MLHYIHYNHYNLSCGTTQAFPAYLLPLHSINKYMGHHPEPLSKERNLCERGVISQQPCDFVTRDTTCAGMCNILSITSPCCVQPSWNHLVGGPSK